MMMVSARAMTVKDTGSEGSEPLNACTSAVAGLNAGDQAGPVHRHRGGGGLPLERHLHHLAVHVERVGDDLHLLADLEGRDLG